MTADRGGRGRCAVCASPHQAEIEAALASGETLRALAQRFGIGRMAISRHQANHLTPALAAVVKKREAAGAESLVDRLEAMANRAKGLMDRAENGHTIKCPKCKEGVVQAPNATAALAAMRELRATLELVGKVTGEIDSRPVTVINLQTTPEWIQLRSAITMALAQFPDARIAVAHSLTRLDA